MSDCLPLGFRFTLLQKKQLKLNWVGVSSSEQAVPVFREEFCNRHWWHGGNLGSCQCNICRDG